MESRRELEMDPRELPDHLLAKSPVEETELPRLYRVSLTRMLEIRLLLLTRSEDLESLSALAPRETPAVSLPRNKLTRTEDTSRTLD